MLLNNLESKTNTAPQRSLEWYKCRVGNITGSNFKLLINPNSTIYKKYIYQKATELILLTPQEDEVYQNKYIQYGIDNEPKARERYCQIKQVEVKESGFIYYPTLHIGCSPDGIVSDGGIIEIKCRQPYKHLEAIKAKMEDKIKEYDKDAYLQCLYNMYITKSQYCDYIQYNDSFIDNDIVIYRIERKQEDMIYVDTILRKAIKDISEIVDCYYSYNL